MDHNNNDTDAIAAAHCCARHSLTPVSLQILARRVARQSLRALVGLLAFGWLFLGIYPAVTSTGLAWQLPQAIAGSVLYVNDAAGRLAAVIDPTSNAAVYHYDAVGNILSINQYPATQVSIITVNPGNSVRSQAQVCGTGFSATLSQNTVSFNGITGTVLAASGACLTVAVPSNATTGTVALTTPTGSATSSTPYGIGSAAPSILGFTPAIGDVGTTITVSGSGLNPVPGATTVFLGATAVSPTSITGSQIVFSVPASAGSGPVKVITPYGQATSTTDFIVAPSAIGSSNIVSYSALRLNSAAQPISINAPGQVGVYAIDATASQLLSIQLTSLVTNFTSVYYQYVSYKVYSPGNIQIAGGVVSTSTMSIHLPAITTPGTYLVVFDTTSGNAQLSATLETAIPLTANGLPLSIAATAAGQSKRLTFRATAGQNLGFSSTPSNNATLTVIYPDGSLFNTNYG
ncbi:MAG: IPT/TIG domain-containing protein [Gammaproteobacteria bacterium]